MNTSQGNTQPVHLTIERATCSVLSKLNPWSQVLNKRHGWSWPLICCILFSLESERALLSAPSVVPSVAISERSKSWKVSPDTRSMKSPFLCCFSRRIQFHLLPKTNSEHGHEGRRSGVYIWSKGHREGPVQYYSRINEERGWKTGKSG